MTLGHNFSLGSISYISTALNPKKITDTKAAYYNSFYDFVLENDLETKSVPVGIASHFLADKSTLISIGEGGGRLCPLHYH